MKKKAITVPVKPAVDKAPQSYPSQVIVAPVSKEEVFNISQACILFKLTGSNRRVAMNTMSNLFLNIVEWENKLKDHKLLF